MVSTIEDTLIHALFLARHLNNCDIKCATIAILLDLGVSPSAEGFNYLQDAIVMYYEDPEQTFTKMLYPRVYKHDNQKSGRYQVERCIRRAVAEAWENRDESVWRCYFPVDEDGNIPRPSNKEFISRVACFLKLWMGFCKEADHGKIEYTQP